MKRIQNWFQTPSAGRWVLQHENRWLAIWMEEVSNPISGEVGAAALNLLRSKSL